LIATDSLGAAFTIATAALHAAFSASVGPDEQPMSKNTEDMTSAIPIATGQERLTMKF
jgi:tetrahydromethanopterin S-methyltransferase subunit C